MSFQKQANQRSGVVSEGSLPWLLAVGTGLAGFSFGIGLREHDNHTFPVAPPPLAKAVEFPENYAPGIALIHLDKEALRDSASIIAEFKREHPNLEIVRFEASEKYISNVGTLYYLKVLYQLRAEGKQFPKESGESNED
jgi:hypothetical protein